MYGITRTSTGTITAASVALILLTSATLATSVYAARHHHGHRSIEDGYQTYGLSGPPLSDQANGNGNNPLGNQVNAPPVNDQANGNRNNPVGNQAPTYKSPSSNNMLMSFARTSTQPVCAAGICSQSYTKH